MKIQIFPRRNALNFRISEHCRSLYTLIATGSQLNEGQSRVTCSQSFTLGNYPVLVLDRLSHVSAGQMGNFDRWSTTVKFYLPFHVLTSLKHTIVVATTSIIVWPEIIRHHLCPPNPALNSISLRIHSRHMILQPAGCRYAATGPDS